MDRGHNLLGAGAFAAALGIKAYLEQNDVSGTVILYGCPGEEGGAAKAFMARDGLWKKLDAALTWHPEDVNEVATGSSNSCIQTQYNLPASLHMPPVHLRRDAVLLMQLSL